MSQRKLEPLLVEIISILIADLLLNQEQIN
jgi:hypothetical protein